MNAIRKPNLGEELEVIEDHLKDIKDSLRIAINQIGMMKKEFDMKTKMEKKNDST